MPAQERSPRARHNARRPPRLGQHFLHDRRFLSNIISALDLNPTDTVVEIGAGQGVLTRVLAERAASVIAVELDLGLVERLRQTFRDAPNVCILHANALHVDLILESVQGSMVNVERDQSSEAQNLATPHGVGFACYKLAGNIPYYITGALLRRYIGGACKPRVAVLMVQLEVAQRMLATPGRMNVMAVSTQLYAEPSIVARVPPRAFRPAPKVESAVIKLQVFERPRVDVGSGDRFFSTVKAGFSTRRKQLINSLANGLAISKHDAAVALEHAHIAPTRRAEDLSLDEWSTLARAFEECGSFPIDSSAGVPTEVDTA
jgi:16S rRNA (adenine1518-N6/adenine1519-N6)-dimethyltransferase